MATIVESIRDEFLRYKALAEAAIAQLGDADLSAAGPNDGNSIAIICWHLSGNLRSRFTDFLTTDGEKAWRKRDEEFEPRAVTREELMAKWQAWVGCAHAGARESDRRSTGLDGHGAAAADARARSPSPITGAPRVSRRPDRVSVEAMRGSDWKYLSIPPGQSDAYNRNPTGERPSAHAATLSKKP
jgi:hypothetical protein